MVRWVSKPQREAEMARPPQRSSGFQSRKSRGRFLQPEKTALAKIWPYSPKNAITESTYAHYSYTLHKYLLPVLSKVPVASLEESFLEQAMQQIIAPTDATHKPLGELFRPGMPLDAAPYLQICRIFTADLSDGTGSCAARSHRQNFCAFLPGGAAATLSIYAGNPTPRKIGLLLGLELGPCIGEISGLQWGNFDLKLGTLKISRTVCRISCGNGHTKTVIQTPKTRTGAYSKIDLLFNS